jgi:hypothetical protein
MKVRFLSLFAHPWNGVTWPIPLKNSLFCLDEKKSDARDGVESLKAPGETQCPTKNLATAIL